jgi:hypothetical protein
VVSVQLQALLAKGLSPQTVCKGHTPSHTAYSGTERMLAKKAGLPSEGNPAFVLPIKSEATNPKLEATIVFLPSLHPFLHLER